MNNIIKLGETATISTENTYIQSYPYLLEHFSKKDQFEEMDFVCGCHIVYGWMPTILHLRLESTNGALTEAANLITKAKKNGLLAEAEIEYLSRLTNNSLVGVSKLLHFISPNNFAIWDSKIYMFLHDGGYITNGGIRKVSSYLKYLSILKNCQSDNRFQSFHKLMNAKIGYKVSGLRALELAIFVSSGNQLQPVK